MKKLLFSFYLLFVSCSFQNKNETPIVILVSFDGFRYDYSEQLKTPHFDYLCSSVFQSLLNLSIQSKVPISNGILTCHNKKQALKRADIKKEDKGGRAVEATISLLKIIK